MKKDLPIEIHQIAFLQAYLYQVFSDGKSCQKSFKYTQWYFKDKYDESSINDIIDFFRSEGVNCDCELINNFNLKDYTSDYSDMHD